MAHFPLDLALNQLFFLQFIQLFSLDYFCVKHDYYSWIRLFSTELDKETGILYPLSGDSAL